MSSNLVVNSVDANNNPLAGYWTVVSQNSAVAATGFTPISWSLPAGTYDVSVGDYGGYYFNHWSDGVTTRDHKVSLSDTSATTLTAIYYSSSPSTQDFVISASPNLVGIIQGSSSTSSITIASIGGFSSGVSLSVKSVSCINANLSNSQVTVPSAGSGKSTLTFSVAPALASGFYSITIVGKSGTTTHSIQLTVSVATSSALTSAASACKKINGAWDSANYACQINGGANINFLLRIPAGVTFDVNTDASLTVSGAGRVVNDGMIDNYWYMTSSNTTIIKNDGRGIINNYGTIGTQGNTTNYGKINIEYGSSISNNFATIYNAQAGIINVSSSSSLYNNGHIINSGKVKNSGYIAEYCSSTFYWESGDRHSHYKPMYMTPKFGAVTLMGDRTPREDWHHPSLLQHQQIAVFSIS